MAAPCRVVVSDVCSSGDTVAVKVRANEPTLGSMRFQAKLSATITRRSDQKFTYFYCDQLIPLDVASSMVADFPVAELQSLCGKAAHATTSSERNPDLLTRVLDSSPVWAQAHAWFMSPAFIADVLTTFEAEILRRYPWFARKAMKRHILNPKRYYGQFQLALRHHGSILSPHTDDADKVLALIVYLPQPGESAEAGGTAFYVPKSRNGERKVFGRYTRLGWLVPLGLRRLRNTKLPTYDTNDALHLVRDDLQFFDNHYTKDFEASYRLGAAGGFIKNQFSWHDLRLDTFAQGGKRLSLLVNVMMRPSRLRSLSNRVIELLSRK